MRRRTSSHLGVVLVLATALATLPGAAESQQDPRVRIAVVDFENNSSWSFWGPRLGQAAADQLADQLVQSDEFSVMERERLRSVMAEQQLGQSGAVSASTAARIGELLGVQVLLTGSVNQFSIDETGGGIGGLSVSYKEAESVLDVRVIDTTTGEVLLTAEGSGQKRFGGASVEDFDFQRDYDAGLAQEALRPAVEQAVEEVLAGASALEGLAPAVAGGEIVGVSEGSYYLDRGENYGVEVGQSFDVYRVVDEIRDGEGNLLDTVTEKVGVVEVARVLSQSSICELVEGDVQEGDTVRPSESGA